MLRLPSKEHPLETIRSLETGNGDQSRCLASCRLLDYEPLAGRGKWVSGNVYLFVEICLGKGIDELRPSLETLQQHAAHDLHDLDEAFIGKRIDHGRPLTNAGHSPAVE